MPPHLPALGIIRRRAPAIDWAVMCDPFGNEFCLVSVLYPHEVKAVLAATDAADGSDTHWRRAAGRTH